MTAARSLLVLIALAFALAFASPAAASGGRYVFEGASPYEQAEVRAALEASAFPWDVVPVTVTVHVGDFAVSHSRRGHVFLDRSLLRAGRFAWAVVQDEYAHQVDFFLFGDETRALLNDALGGADWCYGVPGLPHGAYGCERFASTLVWAYWPSRDNAYRPNSRHDESAAMAPAAFRSLMNTLLGVPQPHTLAAAPSAARRP